MDSLVNNTITNRFLKATRACVDIPCDTSCLFDSNESISRYLDADDLGITGNSERIKPEKQENEIQLPMRIIYRWFWTSNNEQYEIDATLYRVEGKLFIHQVHAQSFLPARLQGMFFKTLSSSALALKSVEQNGFRSWWVHLDNGPVPILEVRNRFKNSDSYPMRSLGPFAQKVRKIILLQQADHCKVANSNLMNRVQDRKAKIIAPPEMYESLPEWNRAHTATLFTEYLTDFFALNFHHVFIAVDPPQFIPLQECVEKVLLSTAGMETLNLLSASQKFAFWLIMYSLFNVPVFPEPTDRGAFAISSPVPNITDFFARTTGTRNLLLSLFRHQNDSLIYFNPVTITDNTVVSREGEGNIINFSVTVNELLESLAAIRNISPYHLQYNILHYQVTKLATACAQLAIQ